MAAILERLKQAHLVAVNIVAARADGSAFVPIVLRLEQEIEARQGAKSDYQRILNLAAHRTA